MEDVDVMVDVVVVDDVDLNGDVNLVATDLGATKGTDQAHR